MHKWQIVCIVSLSLIGLCGPALAGDANAIAPTNDTLGCAGFIQQGDMDLPLPALTHDIPKVQVCMNNCDSLYKDLGDKGRFAEMLRGINYCRKSLNNLYFASVAQTITQELNQQTQLQQAATEQSMFDKMTQLIKQQQNQKAAAATAPDEDSSLHTAPSSTPPAQPPVNLDNVNW